MKNATFGFCGLSQLSSVRHQLILSSEASILKKKMEVYDIGNFHKRKVVNVLHHRYREKSGNSFLSSKILYVKSTPWGNNQVKCYNQLYI